MKLIFSGSLHKMRTNHREVVEYVLKDGERSITVNDLIGKPLKLEYGSEIHCCNCGRKTKKSFNQGYCYPCFQRLAQCDRCIMSPELCHYAAGTCREPEWGEANCHVDHIVYLANTTKVKVGITRHTQVPTRWMDQGATQALPIARVSSRYLSGLVEVTLKAKVSDKTSWQAMLKGNGETLDLKVIWAELQTELYDELEALQQEYGLQAIQYLDAEEYAFNFPVSEFPTKVKSFNLDKTPVVEGLLKGIKGQYLIFDTGVINIRKFTSYDVSIYA